MISGMHLLRGITSTNLNHFTGFQLRFSWQGIHITWASHLCQFPPFPGPGIRLLREGLDRHWGLFFPSVSHCLTYSSLDETSEVMVYQGAGAHSKLIRKAHFFIYSDFFKQKGFVLWLSSSLPATTAQHALAALRQALSHALSALTSPTTQGTRWYHLCLP